MNRAGAALLTGLVAGGVLSACATAGRLHGGVLNQVMGGDPAAARALINAARSDAKLVASLTQELTPENEYYVGRTVAVRVLDTFDYRYRTGDYPAASGASPADLRESSLTEYVNQIGLVLADAALERADRKGDRPAPLAGWHFVVVESELVNAYAAPGGFIFVTIGALKAARSEDELACVLAHEVAHVARGHALKIVKQSRWADVPAAWLHSSESLSPEDKRKLQMLFDGMIGDILDALLVKGYSRESEAEADALGAQIARAAGYDPRALIGFLATVRDRGEGRASGPADSHGSPAERIEHLRALPTLATGEQAPVPARARRFAVATRLLR